MLTFLRMCPFCCSGEIYKSSYRGLEFLLTLLLLRPVRCGECNQRHYRPLFYRALPRRVAAAALPQQRLRKSA